MGHGRGQPDRLPLARPLARSLAHARGTGHPPGGKGTRYESHARGPTPGPASTRLAPPPHPTPPRPHPLKRGGEAPGVGGRREHRRAAARGSTSRRARGRAGGAGRGRERRTTTTRPRDPTGRGERTRRGAEDRRRRRRAAGEGATRRKTRRSPPDRQGPPLPPPLSLHATSRACAAKTPHDRRVAGSRAPNPLERHQNPAGSGARGTARPQPGGKRAAAEGHRGVPRATTGARIPGARPRARHGLGASRPPRQGEALFGGGAGRGRNPRRRGGPRQGAGRTPPPPPPPPRWGRAANGRRRRPGLDPPTDIARAPSRAARGLGPTPPPHPQRNTPCPKDRLRREEAPKGTAAAKANGLGASPLVRLFPLTGGARPPKASQPPPPAPSQPTPPSHTRSVKRAGGGGRAWGGGWGAGQIRQEAEGARQCLHLGGRRAHGGPARTPQPRHPRRGKHPGGGD